MVERVFTIEEARQMLPELKELFKEANINLDLLLIKLQEANSNYQEAEKNMASMSSDLDETRRCRAAFEAAIQELQEAQSTFLEQLSFWVDKITARGVLIRSMREGLVDFPAQKGGFNFLLCWRADENDIDHWHLVEDGFSGRKPLVTLSEYC